MINIDFCIYSLLLLEQGVGSCGYKNMAYLRIDTMGMFIKFYIDITSIGMISLNQILELIINAHMKKRLHIAITQ